MPDLSMVFVPQWSPFQPSLSLPSLSAWLKRAGFDVRSVDANILFYEWLYSDECARRLVAGLDSAPGMTEAAGYRAILSDGADFRRDLNRLREPQRPGETAEDYTARSYLAVQSFETYLSAISEASGEFVLSQYGFRFASQNLRAKALERRVLDPPEILDVFAHRVAEDVLSEAPSVVGLSCIGQEQLYFTLLIGRHLKEASAVPVLIGGTIFSRIFERGALKPEWFGRFFDVIVRNEGERPTEHLLTNIRGGKELYADVPGIVYFEQGEMRAPQPAAPLNPAELPVPDFDDMPLGRYMSPEITLPLLTARGCYWGKCEFCHHGMVYGEKYAPYKPYDILDAVEQLAQRYGVRHFAFNDEAIPPKVLRAVGERFPPHSQTGWTFTGLIKFEKTYKRVDFERFHAAGCRSLYVGLESASEHVLDLMKKRSARETIIANLKDATEAGIWMHCFLFFGFPGETDADAQETVDFIAENAAIISSYGAGTFSLEHNSPIFHHYEDFGVTLKSSALGDLDVYYDYDVNVGISADRALEWQDKLRKATERLTHYRASNWIPRELLLCLLSMMTTDELLEIGPAVRECAGLPEQTPAADFLTLADATLNLTSGTKTLINRVHGRVLAVEPRAADALAACIAHGVTAEMLRRLSPEVFDRIAHFPPEGQAESLPSSAAALVSAA